MISGENLKRFRVNKKLTQEGIADIIGVKRTAYAHYETGRVEMSTEMLQKLAVHFKMTIDQLIKVINGIETDEKESPNKTAEANPGYITMDFKEKYYNLLETHDKRFAALEVTIIRLTEMLESERTKRPTADTVDKLEQAGV